MAANVIFDKNIGRKISASKLLFKSNLRCLARYCYLKKDPKKFCQRFFHLYFMNKLNYKIKNNLNSNQNYLQGTQTFFSKCIRYWVFWNLCFQMEKERGESVVSLKHPLTNFKKRYTQKTSGCVTVKWFIRLGLDLHEGILRAPFDNNCVGNSLMQIVWSLHSQKLSLRPKIGLSKKQKLNSKPRYSPDHDW